MKISKFLNLHQFCFVNETVLSRNDDVEETAEEPLYPMVDNSRLVEPKKEIEVAAEPGGKEQEATAQDDAAVVE